MRPTPPPRRRLRSCARATGRELPPASATHAAAQLVGAAERLRFHPAASQRRARRGRPRRRDRLHVARTHGAPASNLDAYPVVELHALIGEEMGLPPMDGARPATATRPPSSLADDGQPRGAAATAAGGIRQVQSWPIELLAGCGGRARASRGDEQEPLSSLPQRGRPPTHRPTTAPITATPPRVEGRKGAGRRRRTCPWAARGRPAAVVARSRGEAATTQAASPRDAAHRLNVAGRTRGLPGR